MKLLLSIPQHILDVLPFRDMQSIIVANNDKIDGIEAATNNYEDMKMILDFCIKQNYVFQCHRPLLNSEEELFEYLDNVHNLSIKYGKKIHIVFHSLFKDNKEISKIETSNYLNKIFEYVNQNKLNIIISLENLNEIQNMQRINIEEIDDLLKEHDELLFTYDIGHEIHQYNKISKLSNVQISKLSNVHIHSVKEKQDHYSITSDNVDFKLIKEAIRNLKDIKYEGNIVLEYAITEIEGSAIKDKFYNYIQSVKPFYDIYIDI